MRLANTPPMAGILSSGPLRRDLGEGRFLAALDPCPAISTVHSAKEWRAIYWSVMGLRSSYDCLYRRSKQAEKGMDGCGTLEPDRGCRRAFTAVTGKSN